MKNFLSSTKGKIIAGAATLAVIAAAIVTVILLNTGYRSIRVEDFSGTSKVSSADGVVDAFKGQNLKSGDKVSVREDSSLTLALDSDKHVIAAELTKFRIEATGVSGKDSRTVIRLETGSIRNIIDNKLLPSESYVVESPNALMSVRGTIFSVTVFFDGEGLCHTVVEVEQGVVEVTEKGIIGERPERTYTLEAGDVTEVISRVASDYNDLPPVIDVENPSGLDNGGTNPEQTESHEEVMNDPDTIAVEQAIETYLNGGGLDTTNFDRITRVKMCGNVAFVVLDDYRYGTRHSADVQSISTNGIGVIGWDENSKMISTVYTSENSLTSLEMFKEMTALQNLEIEYGNLSSLSGLEELTELTDLSITHCKLSDISSISGLSKLRNLDLTTNEISDITPISQLSQLEKLAIDCNQVSDITPVSSLANLSSLSLCVNQLTDISALSSLSNLTYLDIGRNQISDISPLSSLSKLNSLVIMQNQISDITALANLTELYKLDLSSNSVTDLSALSNLTNLRVLSVYRNGIADYSPIYTLTELVTLDISGETDEVTELLKQKFPNTQIDNRR